MSLLFFLLYAILSFFWFFFFPLLVVKWARGKSETNFAASGTYLIKLAKRFGLEFPGGNKINALQKYHHQPPLKKKKKRYPINMCSPLFSLNPSMWSGLRMITPGRALRGLNTFSIKALLSVLRPIFVCSAFAPQYSLFQLSWLNKSLNRDWSRRIHEIVGKMGLAFLPALKCSDLVV